MARSGASGFLISLMILIAGLLLAFTAGRYPVSVSDLLASIARVVILTAATPGQGGTDHVNEQPNGYWIDKFRQRAFRFEERLTHRWRNEWVEKQVTTWYWANLMVFSREGGQRDLA